MKLGDMSHGSNPAVADSRSPALGTPDFEAQLQAQSRSAWNRVFAMWLVRLPLGGFAILYGALSIGLLFKVGMQGPLERFLDCAINLSLAMTFGYCAIAGRVPRLLFQQSSYAKDHTRILCGMIASAIASAVLYAAAYRFTNEQFEGFESWRARGYRMPGDAWPMFILPVLISLELTWVAARGDCSPLVKTIYSIIKRDRRKSATPREVLDHRG